MLRFFFLSFSDAPGGRCCSGTPTSADFTALGALCHYKNYASKLSCPVQLKKIPDLFKLLSVADFRNSVPLCVGHLSTGPLVTGLQKKGFSMLAALVICNSARNQFFFRVHLLEKDFQRKINNNINNQLPIKVGSVQPNVVHWEKIKVPKHDAA